VVSIGGSRVAVNARSGDSAEPVAGTALFLRLRPEGGQWTSRRRAAREGFADLGFDHVTLDLEGYRTGSVSPAGDDG
jgi:hypothetical protein